MSTYQDDFHPLSYLKTYYQVGANMSEFKCFPLKFLYEFFANQVAVSQPITEYKVLDYGSGPAVANVVSAAKVATEIILAEFGEKTRRAIQQWLNKEDSAWDWSPNISYIVQGRSKLEVAEREEKVRQLIKAVVPCDITEDKPIQEGYEGPYDAVVSILCLEAGCRTHDEYKTAIKKMWCLLKPNGSILLHSTIRKDPTKASQYTFGSHTFEDLPLTLDFIHSTLAEAKFVDITTETGPNPPPWMDGHVFITARKVTVYT